MTNVATAFAVFDFFRRSVVDIYASPVLSIPIDTRTHTGEQMLAKIETRIDKTRDFHSLRIEQWCELFLVSCVSKLFL